MSLVSSDCARYVDPRSFSDRSMVIERPRLRKPVSAARVVCGSQSVAAVSSSSVCATIALKQFEDPRQFRAASGRGRAWGPRYRNFGNSPLDDFRARGGDPHASAISFRRVI
jgi:hypothetical protein